MKAFRATTLLLLAALFAAPALADTLITSKSHSDSIMGQPARDETTTMWIGKDRMARSGTDSSIIIRADQKKLYMIDPQDKTYSELDLPIDLAKYFPPEMQAQIGAMMQQMKMTAKVTPTDQTKKIGNWNTKLYKAEIANAMGMKMDIDMWVTKEISIDYAAYKDLANSLQGLQMGFEDVAKEMAKIDGISVLTENTMNIMGNTMKTREEIVSAESKPAPAGTYDVPAGLTKETFNPMKAAQEKSAK
ncbi:MAG: DUF4412 domain-containing protein [Acidobacteria bacterium]|jgi:hypothetical protein|nr:DUF4412 domain-containing protein [Acidobacteriota bacterium]MCU0254124.1 DUF4412 domain-containing protein [Acidobacteriota bacterium]